MESSAALLAGLVAGLAIAMQVGAVSVLLVEAAVVEGPLAGVAAGMGVATADLAFALVAVAAGGAAGAVLQDHELEIRLVAAAALAAIAVQGLIALARSGAAAAPAAGPSADAAGPSADAAGRLRPRAHYARFLAITIANPLTIASFAAVATSLSLPGPVAAAAFVAGVGAASGAWHLVLSLAAGHAGGRLTPRARLGLAIGGRLAVLAIAAQLVLAG
jgi:threonine/homoserine/homoserine lactone efflux protein